MGLSVELTGRGRYSFSERSNLSLLSSFSISTEATPSEVMVCELSPFLEETGVPSPKIFESRVGRFPFLPFGVLILMLHRFSLHFRRWSLLSSPLQGAHFSLQLLLPLPINRIHPRPRETPARVVSVDVDKVIRRHVAFRKPPLESHNRDPKLLRCLRLIQIPLAIDSRSLYPLNASIYHDRNVIRRIGQTLSYQTDYTVRSGRTNRTY